MRRMDITIVEDRVYVNGELVYPTKDPDSKEIFLPQVIINFIDKYERARRNGLGMPDGPEATPAVVLADFLVIHRDQLRSIKTKETKK